MAKELQTTNTLPVGTPKIEAVPGSACATCPAYNAGQLERLGVDMTDCDYVVALAGNPNTGKSTVFNALTGLRQHTGNWPGKTVARAEGGFDYGDQMRYKLVDLPGTYSLLSTSLDEEIARDFILFGRPDVTVVVVDATRLERNLNLVLQVLEITDRAVVCLNLMDEARRTGLVRSTIGGWPAIWACRWCPRPPARARGWTSCCRRSATWPPARPSASPIASSRSHPPCSRPSASWWPNWRRSTPICPTPAGWPCGCWTATKPSSRPCSTASWAS